MPIIIRQLSGICTFVYYGVTKVTIVFRPTPIPQTDPCSPCEIIRRSLSVCLPSAPLATDCLPSGQQQNVQHSQKAPNQLGAIHFIETTSSPSSRAICRQADNTKLSIYVYNIYIIGRFCRPPAAHQPSRHCIIRYNPCNWRSSTFF